MRTTCQRSGDDQVRNVISISKRCVRLTWAAPSAGKEPAVDMDKAAMWTDIFGPETEVGHLAGT